MMTTADRKFWAAPVRKTLKCTQPAQKSLQCTLEPQAMSEKFRLSQLPSKHPYFIQLPYAFSVHRAVFLTHGTNCSQEFVNVLSVQISHMRTKMTLLLLMSFSCIHSHRYDAKKEKKLRRLGLKVASVKSSETCTTSS